MNSRITSLLLLACVLLVPVAFVFTASATQQDAQQENAASWEHLALPYHGNDLGGDLSKQITRLGNEGWQLVCVTSVAREGTTTKMIYYFKRPK